jgi:hypothetical protein
MCFKDTKEAAMLNLLCITTLFKRKLKQFFYHPNELLLISAKFLTDVNLHFDVKRKLSRRKRGGI